MEDLEITPQVVAEAPDPREERIGQLEAKLAESEKTIRSLEKNVSKHKGTAEALAEIKNEIRLMKAAREDEKAGREIEPESQYQRVLREIESEKAKPEEVPTEIVEISAVAQEICTDHGWNVNSPQYKKAVELGPREGLRYLYKEAAAFSAKAALDKAELERKKAIKESGGTASSPGPSAASLDNDEFLRDFSSGKLNSPADFKRAAELLK